MLRDPLDMILGTRTKVRILRSLIVLDRPVTGREAARLAGVSHMAQQALAELSDVGILECTILPSGHLYRMNEENDLFPSLVELFGAERSRYADLLARIRELLGEQAGVAGASFFGSAARAEETAESDLDLLVVVEQGESKAALSEALNELGSRLSDSYGINLSPVILTREELDRQKDDPDSLVGNVLPHARSIYGAPIEQILQGDAP